MSSVSWLKYKYEASTQKVVEIVQAYNEISNKYNELNSTADLMKRKNAFLLKSLKAVEETFSIQEAELKQVEWHAEYYEDKSSSIEMHTTVKVRAKMLKEYIERKTFSWDP